MYLIIDFGITKLANKVKKKSWEKGLVGRYSLKDIRLERSWLRDKLESSPRLLGENKAGREIWTGRNRQDIRYDNRLPILTRKYKSGETVPRSKVIREMIPDTKNFTDIRKVNDTYLSRSGYMGFKNTPNSFHEEAIPLVGTGKIIKKIKPRIIY